MDKLDNLGKKYRGKKMTSKFLPGETENRHCACDCSLKLKRESVWGKSRVLLVTVVLEDNIAFCPPKKIISGSAKWGLNHRGKGNIQFRNLGITEEIQCVKSNRLE